MKKITLNFFAVFTLLFGAATGWAQQSLQLPAYQKTKLPNGVTVILMRQSEVPIVSFSLNVKAGSVNDPSGKEGVAGLTADLLRKGTKNRTAEQLSAELDFVGGQIEFEARPDTVRGHAEFLKKDAALGLDLIADVLLQPTFPPAEVTKLVAQRVDGLKQAKDSAQNVIQNYFNAYLFGAHAYGRPSVGTEQTVAALKRTDILNFYTQFFTPQNTTIAVVGDFDPASMLNALKNKFGGWSSKSAAAPPKLTDPTAFKGKKLLLVDKPDSTQTFFQIGNVGVARTNKDRVGIAVVNTIFGGRFTSILNDALRVNSGLTYGARSTFVQRQAPGSFFISTYTQNKTTVQAIDMALDLLEKLHENGLTEAQLKSAKAYIKGTYPTQVETTNQLADLLTDYDFYGLDERELNQYFAQIDALTLDDTRRVIKDYFPRENLVFVLIGKADEIRAQVKKYASQMDEKKITEIGF